MGQQLYQLSCYPLFYFDLRIFVFFMYFFCCPVVAVLVFGMTACQFCIFEIVMTNCDKWLCAIRSYFSLQITVKIFVWHLSQTNRLADVKAPLANIYLGGVSSFDLIWVTWLQFISSVIWVQLATHPHLDLFSLCCLSVLLGVVYLEGCGIVVVIDGPRTSQPTISVIQSSFQVDEALFTLSHLFMNGWEYFLSVI